MSDQNLEGFNSKPKTPETKGLLVPDPDLTPSDLPEVDTEITQTVDEEPVTQASDIESSSEESATEEVSQGDQTETPLDLPIINTTYVSPDNESTEQEVAKSEPMSELAAETDSSIEELPKEKVERKLTEPELRS
jgi:hypothetical protein